MKKTYKIPEIEEILINEIIATSIPIETDDEGEDW